MQQLKAASTTRQLRFDSFLMKANAGKFHFKCLHGKNFNVHWTNVVVVVIAVVALLCRLQRVATRDKRNVTFFFFFFFDADNFHGQVHLRSSRFHCGIEFRAVVLSCVCWFCNELVQHLLGLWGLWIVCGLFQSQSGFTNGKH